MPDLEKQDDREYVVVKNGEDQYSIYFTDRELPAGWIEAGKVGSKTECLDYIKDVWTDMTPKSLRESADGRAAASASHNGASKTGNAASGRNAGKNKVAKKTASKKGAAKKSSSKKS